MTGSRALSVLVALLLAGAGLAESGPVRAYRVIAHPSNPTMSLEPEHISKLFLKKATKWDHGGTVDPVDQTLGSKVRVRFSDEIHGRSPLAVRRYWERMIFSGRGVPPPELASDAAVIAYVQDHRDAIGYVSATAALKDVKEIAIRK